jgi:hypothetical protein
MAGRGGLVSMSKFAGILKMIVPKIVERYMEERDVSCGVAIERLYNSKLYEALEDRETSLWRLSPLLLCDLLIEELETGKITWPEEQ